MRQKLFDLWSTKTKDDEWWSSFVTAPIAIMVNSLVVDIKVLTPSRITLCSFIVAILSAVLIVVGGRAGFISAAILIQFSHVLDCMDGQMARYRRQTSLAGCFFDKLTDQLQVSIWFAAAGYAAYCHTQSILPVFLAFIGVAFYNFRGYSKYVYLDTKRDNHNQGPKKISVISLACDDEQRAGFGFGFMANLIWFIREQPKIFYFNEGVFVFMLSLSLIINQLTLMLWVFAVSQIYYGLVRSCQRWYHLIHNKEKEVKK